MSILNTDLIEQDFLCLGSVFTIERAEFAPILFPFEVKNGVATLKRQTLSGQLLYIDTYKDYPYSASAVYDELFNIPVKLDGLERLRPDEDAVLDFVKKYVYGCHPILKSNGFKLSFSRTLDTLFASVFFDPALKLPNARVHSVFTLRLKLPQNECIG